MNVVGAIISILVKVLNIGFLARKERRRREIADDPVNAFTDKFGGVRDDSKPMQQADSEHNSK